MTPDEVKAERDKYHGCDLDDLLARLKGTCQCEGGFDGTPRCVVCEAALVLDSEIGSATRHQTEWIKLRAALAQVTADFERAKRACYTADENRDKALTKLAQVTAERNEARQHLQEALDAEVKSWAANDKLDRELSEARAQLAAAEQLLVHDRYEDFDGPCWCYKRNAGPYERNGHSAACLAKKAYVAR